MVKANRIVFVTGVLFLLLYPFSEHFLWGLLCHIMGAACIGGLADWYGIEALFRTPLGITYKTNIISRERDALVQMVDVMLEKELLSKKALYSAIKRSHPVRRLLTYVQSDEGLTVMQRLITKVGQPLWQEGSMADGVKEHIQELVAEIQGADVAVSGLEWLLQEGRYRELYRYFMQVIHDVMEREETQVMCERIAEYFIEESKKSQQLHWTQKIIFTYMVGARSLGKELHRELMGLLEGAQDIESVWGKYYVNKLHALRNLLSEDEKLREKIHTWQVQQLSAWVAWGLASMKPHIENAFFKNEKSVWKDYIMGMDVNSDKYLQMERLFLYKLSGSISAIKREVHAVAMQSLQSVSGERMADILYTSTYKDLEMIRVNGSVVGALLGGGFYLLTVGVKEVLSCIL